MPTPTPYGGNFVKRWLLYTLLGWLQRKCAHPSDTVTFDIREASVEEHDSIKWCRVCGAVRVGNGDWREPRADWWIK
jgi:hypothetical protein